MTHEQIKKVLELEFEKRGLAFSEFVGELTVRVPRELIVAVCLFLRDRPDLRFNYLSDLTAVDYLNQDLNPRFEVVYHLYSVEHHHRLRLKAGVPESEPKIDSVTGVWRGAEKAECEVYDMFGIRFENHPNLKRILMPDDWEGHPLRKDFPLGGGKSFYFKRDTQQYAGEPKDLVPRIRIQDGDV